MPTPSISKKTSDTLSVSDRARSLFQVIYYDLREEDKLSEDIPRIKVSEVISKMAFYYEKIRNTVDYEEEHLHRKNAIDRILKRQIIIEGTFARLRKDLSAEDIAKHLITELISAGYLPNNQVPEGKVHEVARIINKYLKLRKDFLENWRELSMNAKNDMVRWIISLAATDIEERLGRNKVDLAVVDYMYRILLDNIKLPENMSELDKDREVQIFLSIHRNFLKFDPDMLSLILMRYYNPSWRNPLDEDIERVAKHLLDIKDAIDRQIDHPLSGQVNKITRKYTVFFSILTEVIAEDPENVFRAANEDPKAFGRLIGKVCEKRYKITRSKLWRAAIRSILYIFITKSIFAVALEVPATKFLGEEINTFSLFVNITFPAALLFVIVLFTKLPKEDNTKKIVEGIEEVVYDEKRKVSAYKLRKPAKRSKVRSFIFGAIYAITFYLSFGGIIWALNEIHFNWVSIVIFIFFLAFVSFFSIRIRRSAKELMVIEEKDRFFGLIVDFFYVPIVEAGKWLSEKFSRINVFVFLLDFVIEAPFKVFITIAEEWTNYVKERKDEI